MKEDDERPDVVIGLVGAAGTDLATIKQQLKAQFASFDYDYEEIKLSSLIAGICALQTQGLPEDQRVRALMDGGDRIRAIHGEGDGVICLAITAMRKIKSDRAESSSRKKPIVFLIDSLKNPQEIQSLDAVYGRNFYTISVYSSVSGRKTRLANRIAETCTTNVREEHRKRAGLIIEEDESRGRTKTSQDVRNTFPKADFFIAADIDPEVHIKRFVELVFGEPFITPTLDEYAMFVAKASALRSADLSRQVGAAIIGKCGEIVSTGCNEVPYPGGGMFFETREGPDNRDHTVEFDPNSSEISNIFRELVLAFKKASLLDKSVAEKSEEEIVAELLHGEWNDLTIDARVRNLIEFGRVVHAEMHAISEASRLGRSVHNLTLFCTTFPCHICARHIISAGLKEVVFIEPYPKSLTKSLYKREISTDESVGDLPGAVLFRPFQGVAPTLYQRAFAYRPRKTKTGTIIHLNRSTAVPIGATFTIANPTLEESLSGRVDEIRQKFNIDSSNPGGDGEAHA